ncbi:hypothetical protein E2I00_000058, partial [Balaenoptera physalus]
MSYDKRYIIKTITSEDVAEMHNILKKYHQMLPCWAKGTGRQAQKELPTKGCRLRSRAGQPGLPERVAPGWSGQSVCISLVTAESTPSVLTYIVECHGITLLPQFLGMYRLNVDGVEIYVIVTRNVFSHRLSVYRKYDLKIFHKQRTVSVLELYPKAPLSASGGLGHFRQHRTEGIILKTSAVLTQKRCKETALQWLGKQVTKKRLAALLDSEVVISLRGLVCYDNNNAKKDSYSQWDFDISEIITINIRATESSNRKQIYFRYFYTYVEAKELPTLKDNDFINEGQKIYIDDNNKKVFLEKLKKDVEFLAQLKLMDYSLLVGIHDVERAEQEEVECEENDGEEEGESDGTHPVGTPPDSPGNTLNSSPPLAPGEFDPNIDVYGIKCHENSPRKEVYFMAIIDILTHYDAKKKAAHAAKTVKHGQWNQPNTIPHLPQKYFSHTVSYFWCSRCVQRTDQDLPGPPNALKILYQSERRVHSSSHAGAGAEISTVNPEQYSKRFLDFIGHIL